MRVLRVRGGCAAMTLARVCLLMHTGVASRCSSCSSLPRTTAPVLWHHAAMLDKLSLTHGCVHRTERVQQQPSATIIRCVQWMQRSRNHSQSLWRPACRPHSTHNHKPWEQFCTHVTNHGLYTGCNWNPNHGLLHGVQIAYLLQNHGLLQGMQFAPRIQTMVL